MRQAAFLKVDTAPSVWSFIVCGRGLLCRLATEYEPITKPPINSSKISGLGDFFIMSCLSNKLFEYISCGLPVIASDFLLHRVAVKDVNCGKLMGPKDPPM